jgi:chromatin assembly factor 1 subunit B
VAGVNKEENEIENVIWGFTRKDLTKPCFLLPTLDKASVCVRFCPIFFEKDQKNQSREPELIDLPYKFVFAVGTIDSVFIYDTQSVIPKYIITNIHLQPITDLAWRGCSMLAASSSDGYITFISFEKDEIGVPSKEESLPEKERTIYSTYLKVDWNKNVLPVHNGI